MILSFYLARRLTLQFVVISFSFIAVLFVVELVEMVRRFGEDGIGLGQAAVLAGLRTGETFYQILPLIAGFAGIALWMGMSRSSELVAIRAAGRSALRLQLAPAITAALLGALSVAVINPFVAASAARYEMAAAKIRGDSMQTATVAAGQIWLRQAVAGDDPDETGQVVIHATAGSSDASHLTDATFLVMSSGGGLQQRIDARSAILIPGAWQLEDVTSWPLSAANPQAEVSHRAGMTLPTELTADGIRDSFGKPSSIPVWKLPAFIKQLEQAGYSANRHRVWLASEIARPALFAAMVMLVAAFTMDHARGRRTGVAALSAFGATVALFFLNDVTYTLTDTGQIPPTISAFSVPLIGALLALALLLRKEDG